MYHFDICKYVTDILKMCMKKFNDEQIFFMNLQHFYLSQFSTISHIEVVYNLCNHLLLEPSLYPFNTLSLCYRHIEDVHEEV